jgi:hypothetical protein
VTEKSLRVILVALEPFVGVSAVEGGIGVMTDGVGLPVEWLQMLGCEALPGQRPPGNTRER